jgi:hypothetical protein
MFGSITAEIYFVESGGAQKGYKDITTGLCLGELTHGELLK